MPTRSPEMPEPRITRPDIGGRLGQAVDARGGYTRTVVEDNGPITAAQFEAGIGMLADRVADLCLAKDHQLQDAVERGIQAGLKAAMKDKELVTSFWRDGFAELTKHSADGASQWVGKRLMTWFAVALLAAILAWLVRNGTIK